MSRSGTSVQSRPMVDHSMDLEENGNEFGRQKDTTRAMSLPLVNYFLQN